MERNNVLSGVLCVMVVMFCTSAFAIAPVGPPTAGLKTEQWSAGFGYAQGEIDNFDIEWSSDIVSGISDSKAKDMKSDAYLAKFGYGVSDDFELYGFLGAADSRGEIEGGLISGSEKIDGGHDFSGGFGAKWTFSKAEQLSWGLVYQMSWSEGDDSIPNQDLSAFGFGASETVDAEINSYDIFLALGPTLEMGSWRIYGGAGLYYYDTDIGVDFMDTTIAEGDADEAMFGGYAGVAVDLNESTSLYAEYMLADDAWILGTGIVWKF